VKTIAGNIIRMDKRGASRQPARQVDYFHEEDRSLDLPDPRQVDPRRQDASDERAAVVRDAWGRLREVDREALSDLVSDTPLEVSAERAGVTPAAIKSRRATAKKNFTRFLEEGGIQPNDSRHDLTSRQQEVSRLYHQGLSHDEIAERLGLSPSTVIQHMHHARKKMGTAKKRN